MHGNGKSSTCKITIVATSSKLFVTSSEEAAISVWIATKKYNIVELIKGDPIFVPLRFPDSVLELLSFTFPAEHIFPLSFSGRLVCFGHSPHFRFRPVSLLRPLSALYPRYHFLSPSSSLLFLIIRIFVHVHIPDFGSNFIGWKIGLAIRPRIGSFARS